MLPFQRRQHFSEFMQLKFAIAFALVNVICLVTGAQSAYQPRKDSAATGTQFERYFTRDKFQREITFYISRQTVAETKLPLIVSVQGSGCMSNFTKRGELVYGGIQNLILNLAKDKARVMVVEKPGVKFLDTSEQPGTALKCSQEFLAEHTLERWAEAVGASLRAAHQLAEIDRTKTLIVGHSEGGIIAARVAAETPSITHVASLSGGGPTQLFDLVELARQNPPPAGSNSASADPGQRVFDAWKDIQTDPDSTAKFFMAHPYRRWSSFMKSSVYEELMKSNAKIYLAQGTLDKAVTVASFDVLRASLVSKERDLTVERLEGADHGFSRGTDDRDGIRKVIANVVSWFLKAENKN